MPMEEYLKENGIHSIEDLKKAIEEMEKINLMLFKGEKINAN
jgi:dihydroorotase